MPETRHSSVNSVNPLITIAIPTRNRATLVRDCVTSALAQTYRNIEVLVSDNASTDDTSETLKSFIDPRLRVLTNSENIGLVGNFNNCIQEAKGDFIVLLSDDNTLEAYFLEKCVQLVRAEPDIPIVLAGYDILVMDEFFQDEVRLVPAVLSKKLTTGIWDGTDILKEYLQGKISAQTLSSIIRTDVLRRNGGYTDAHPSASDEAAFIPLLLEGRAGLVNERCATYKVHKSNVSVGLTADFRLRDLSKVMEEISVLAEANIADKTTRQDIQRLTSRYVAYQSIINIVIYRRDGARFIDIAQQLWKWRKLLKRCKFADFIATWRLRSLARIFLPRPILRLSIALGIDKRI
jgi:glycosyltransferase involved in cell wall biosynthesis